MLTSPQRWSRSNPRFYGEDSKRSALSDTGEYHDSAALSKGETSREQLHRTHLLQREHPLTPIIDLGYSPQAEIGMSHVRGPEIFPAGPKVEAPLIQAVSSMSLRLSMAILVPSGDFKVRKACQR